MQLHTQRKTNIKKPNVEFGATGPLIQYWQKYKTADIIFLENTLEVS